MKAPSRRSASAKATWRRDGSSSRGAASSSSVNRCSRIGANADVSRGRSSAIQSHSPYFRTIAGPYRTSCLPIPTSSRASKEFYQEAVPGTRAVVGSDASTDAVREQKPWKSLTPNSLKHSRSKVSPSRFRFCRRRRHRAAGTVSRSSRHVSVARHKTCRGFTFTSSGHAPWSLTRLFSTRSRPCWVQTSSCSPR